MTQNIVGEMVRRDRLEKGLTLKQYAKSIKINYATLSLIERGEYQIGINIRKKLAKVLHLSNMTIYNLTKNNDNKENK